MRRLRKSGWLLLFIVWLIVLSLNSYIYDTTGNNAIAPIGTTIILLYLYSEKLLMQWQRLARAAEGQSKRTLITISIMFILIIIMCFGGFQVIINNDTGRPDTSNALTLALTCAAIGGVVQLLYNSGKEKLADALLVNTPWTLTNAPWAFVASSVLFLALALIPNNSISHFSSLLDLASVIFLLIGCMILAMATTMSTVMILTYIFHRPKNIMPTKFDDVQDNHPGI